jgi:hypothetical protein
LNPQEIIVMRLPWTTHLAKALFLMASVVDSYDDAVVFSGTFWTTVLQLPAR